MTSHHPRSIFLVLVVLVGLLGYLHFLPSSAPQLPGLQTQSDSTFTDATTTADMTRGGGRSLRQLSTTTSTSGASLKVDFAAAIAQINKITNLIYQRYEFHHAQRYQFFLESQNMPVYGWDLMKYKIALKILSPPIADKADINNNTFTKTYNMIFGGSSVTAGHDNYYHQSYPFVFQRRMEAIFTTLGLGLNVHNIAQGANNCRPSDYCYEAMGGENADFISWEQSFNCGRSKDIMEFIARVAYWNKAIVYYVASGAFLPNGCAKTTDKIPWTSEEWTPESVGITDKYTVSADKVTQFRDTTGAWYDDGNAVSRFTVQVYGGLYKGVGPHGYSVWGHSSHLCNNGTGCTAIDVKGDCFEKGGAHWMVAETAYYAGEEGKHGKSWHPPAGMHLMRGEVLAWNYAHVLADTVYMMEADSKKMSPAEMFQKYLAAWKELLVPIPEKGLHLGVEESGNPTCYTNFGPHFNPTSFLNNITIGGTPGWVVTEKYDHWSTSEQKYGYQDTRPVFESTGGGKLIHFKISNVRQGAVRVCGYSRKESLKHAVFFLDPFYAFPKDTPISQLTYKPTDKRIKIDKRQYVQDECTRLYEIPLGGDHVLTIETDPNNPVHTTSLTHVIVF